MLDVAAAQQVLDDSPFGPWWGFRVDELDAGRATVRLPARPELFRPGGVLQGGCAMTLADVTVWIAIMTTSGVDDTAVTVGQTSAFVGAARSDIVCRAELIRSGRSLVVGTAVVHDAHGTLVSHNTLTYARPRSRAASARAAAVG